jgi:hypothetical protein
MHCRYRMPKAIKEKKRLHAPAVDFPTVKQVSIQFYYSQSFPPPFAHYPD